MGRIFSWEAYFVLKSGAKRRGFSWGLFFSMRSKFSFVLGEYTFQVFAPPEAYFVLDSGRIFCWIGREAYFVLNVFLSASQEQNTYFVHMLGGEEGLGVMCVEGGSAREQCTTSSENVRHA